MSIAQAMTMIRGSVFLHARAIARCAHAAHHACVVDVAGKLKPAWLCTACGALLCPLGSNRWTRPELLEQLVDAVAST